MSRGNHVNSRTMDGQRSTPMETGGLRRCPIDSPAAGSWIRICAHHTQEADARVLIKDCPCGLECRKHFQRSPAVSAAGCDKHMLQRLLDACVNKVVSNDVGCFPCTRCVPCAAATGRGTRIGSKTARVATAQSKLDTGLPPPCSRMMAAKTAASRCRGKRPSTSTRYTDDPRPGSVMPCSCVGSTQCAIRCNSSEVFPVPS